MSKQRKLTKQYCEEEQRQKRTKLRRILRKTERRINTANLREFAREFNEQF